MSVEATEIVMGGATSAVTPGIDELTLNASLATFDAAFGAGAARTVNRPTRTPSGAGRTSKLERMKSLAWFGVAVSCQNSRSQ